jgi:ABC-type nitrate/sulfonate/bicarbonate transport system permease component
VREYILPSPLTVLRALMGSEIRWAGHLWITTLEIVGVFLLAGAVGVLRGTAIGELSALWDADSWLRPRPLPRMAPRVPACGLG